MTPIHCSLTNVYASGGFTVGVLVGSRRCAANLIVDSGSSTLVVASSAYDGRQDTQLTATSLAQDITYGVGGWFGPTVVTCVRLADAPDRALDPVPVAIALTEQAGSFLEADGILGLAYHGLNKAFDFRDYLTEKQVNPPVTFPWPFTGDDRARDVDGFKRFLFQQPERDVEPYFTALEAHGVTANRFALHTHRSSIHHAAASQTTEGLRRDPLNGGELILGTSAPGHHRWQDVPIEHDVYYNVTLDAVQVGDLAPRPAAALAPAHQSRYFTNAIIDSGASYVVLANQLHQGVMADLASTDPDFARILEPFQTFQGKDIGIGRDRVDLSRWPTLRFHFHDVNNRPLSVPIEPSQYWQLNAPMHGQASFKLISQLPDWPNQSILGLPLLNDSMVVFDRAYHGLGRIRFGR